MDIIVNGTTLEHHGTLGQKHGVRQVPWYPIEDYRQSLINKGYKITDPEIKRIDDAKAKVQALNSAKRDADQKAMKYEVGMKRAALWMGSIGIASANVAMLNPTAGAAMAGVTIAPAVASIAYKNTKMGLAEAKVNKLIDELEKDGVKIDDFPVISVLFDRGGKVVKSKDSVRYKATQIKEKS